MKLHFTHFVSASRKRTAGNGSAFNVLVRQALDKGVSTFKLEAPSGNPEHTVTVTVKENEPCVLTFFWPNQWGEKVETVTSPPGSLLRWKTVW